MIRCAILAFALLATAPASAQLAPPARQAEAGTIDVSTSAELAPVLNQLARAFERNHPGEHVRVIASASNVAVARLTVAKTDLAIIGRAMTEQEAKGFEWIYLHPADARPVFSGSDQTPGLSPRLAVIVANASPLQSITLGQLSARFLSGGKGAIAMPDAESGSGRFFRSMVLGGANQLDWGRITELSESDHARPGLVADKAAALVARDKQAIGIADARAHKGTREIPVTDAPGLLERRVMAYANAPARREVSEFVDFLVSGEASPIIAASPYRPLKNPRSTGQ